MTKRFLGILLVCLMAISTVFAAGQTETTATAPEDEKKVITIWYEGNDQRLPFFKAAEAAMQKDYPNYSINAVTFDNATIVAKSLQAATATGGVDLIFNEANRLLLTYQQSEGAFEDLTDVLAEAKNNSVVKPADLSICSSGDALVVFPINRSCSALGYKTDIIDVADDQIPNTWNNFVELGKRYEEAGIAGWTLHLGTDPGQVFNLILTSGNGIHGIWISEKPESTIQQNKEKMADIIELYTAEDGIWDPDAVNEDFAGMYTKILSSSVGMFRVGNWNVVKWDQPDSGVGEYAVTTWPSFDDNPKGTLHLGGVRGLAMPKNAPEKEAAKVFLKYCLETAPQAASFDTMGSCMDYSVVDKSTLTKNQKIFFDPEVGLEAVDSYMTDLPYYPELFEAYEMGLRKAFAAKDRAGIIAALDKTDENLKKIIEKNN